MLTVLVSVVVLTASGCGTNQSTTANDPGDSPSPADHSLDCSTDEWSQGDVDVVPPTTAAEARRLGWPSTPEEAAQSMLHSAAFRGVGATTLDDGVRATQGDQDAVEFAGLRPDGSTALVLSVQEYAGGVWAVTSVKSCAPSDPRASDDEP